MNADRISFVLTKNVSISIGSDGHDAAGRGRLQLHSGHQLWEIPGRKLSAFRSWGGAAASMFCPAIYSSMADCRQWVPAIEILGNSKIGRTLTQRSDEELLPGVVEVAGPGSERIPSLPPS